MTINYEIYKEMLQCLLCSSSEKSYGRINPGCFIMAMLLFRTIAHSPYSAKLAPCDISFQAQSDAPVGPPLSLKQPDYKGKKKSQR